ncbi:MAG: N-acetylmuramoyl-L-alanine amidase, partial [Porphyromonas sp.]|nr:N-acetylmuramoyl-L-alanine amidase [Porphyromonas sp.]
MTKRNLFILFCAVLLNVSFYSASARNSKGQFVVVIDPGHGGKDSGALGAISKEKDIVLKVGLRVRELLRQQDPNITVLMTRSTDVFIGLNERADYANRNHADLFVSIHANSAKPNVARGVETYTLGLARSEENLRVAMKENSVILKEDDYKTKYEGFDPHSTESYIMFEFMQNKHMESAIKLAQGVQKNLVSGGRRVNRGVKQNIFLVLRRTSMPSILIELGFISHRQEENYMNSPAGIDEMSRSISSAVIRYKKELDKKLSGSKANV